MNFIYTMLVGLGGFGGAISRYAISDWMRKRGQLAQYPLATLFVNFLGSFLLGLIIGKELNELWMIFFGIGFLGAFTTFSTFTLETIQLLKDKKVLVSLLYLLFSYLGGVLIALLGIIIGRVL